MSNEPVTREIMHYTGAIVELVVDHKTEWSFKLDRLPDTWFYMRYPITLTHGDRVKITITKEPVPDAFPR